ncbi:hypothetical protein [Alkalibacillus haloalkaliphilus]|uniref:hypothetical protein n=1 Tax=Alkalibacillus haloalkaliphilus TaxID=94136 RepID=UPI00037C4C5F|nr:hypothetical protein [Alkalibacillus haloalkaliphilus]
MSDRIWTLMLIVITITFVTLEAQFIVIPFMFFVNGGKKKLPCLCRKQGSQESSSR